MDVLEWLAVDGEISFAVLGRGEDFALIRLDNEGEPLNAEAVEQAQDKGFNFCGLLGWKAGQAGMKCQYGQDAAITMARAYLAFTKQIAGVDVPQPSGDSSAWLERLWRL